MSVRVESQGPVTTVIIDRPAVRNAVNPETARALYDAFVAFDHDPDAAVAVLWGAGGAFCGGYDLHSLATGELPFGTLGGKPPLGGPMGPTHLELQKPVIAAIAGPAVAGGLELAVWCDLRVMEEDAYMGVYCRRWGVPLIDGGTVRLPRLLGRGRALDLILTGRRVDAGECERIGLCERVVPSGTARSAAEALAADIARFPQACLRADRASARASLGLDERTALERELAGGVPVVSAESSESMQGARRFAAGSGRHGDFGG